jgi:CubicO group peptidase (beta-lactamase class C family)
LNPAIWSYGCRNPVTKETLLGVGSLNKGIASLEVLNLVEEGKIDLHADKNDLLISWKIPQNEFTRQNKVTPLLLMNHSGGAMFYPGIGYLRDNYLTNLRILRGEKSIQYRPVVIDKIPGTLRIIYYLECYHDLKIFESGGTLPSN